MGFKLGSKKNMGIFAIFILVILLSQSNYFHFLTDTPLGRISLLSFIIFIAYTNQILGLIAVLCIVIAFNNNVNIVSGYNLYEGLSIMSSLKNTNLPGIQQQIDKEEEEKKSKIKAQKLWKEAKKKASSSKAKKGIEGFCMTDRETNMLRGKQSNAISVSNNLREQPDDVSPSDKSVFTSEYSTF